MIYRLPYFAQLAVVQQLELYECFFLGSLSKKSKRLVQRSMRNVIETTSIDLKRNMINVKERASYSQGVFVWRTIDRKGLQKLKRCRKDMWINLECNGVQMKFRVTFDKDLRMPRIWCDPENLHFLPIALHTTVCDVFNTPKSVKVKMGISEAEIAQFPYITEVDHLAEACYVWMGVDRSVLEKILKRVKINQSLTLNSSVKLNSNSPVLSIDHLKLNSATEMTRESLLNFTGKTLMFSHAEKIISSDLIDFVKNWLTGTNNKLESICISTCWPTFKKQKILEQFDTKPWDPKKRDGRFMYSKNAVRWQSDIDILDCTQQLDIEREHDGLLATMIVTNKIFCFFVWHTPFAKPGNNLPVMAKSEPNQLPRYYLGSVVY